MARKNKQKHNPHLAKLRKMLTPRKSRFAKALVDQKVKSRPSALHAMDSQNHRLCDFAPVSSFSEWSFHLVPDKTLSQSKGSMGL